MDKKYSTLSKIPPKQPIDRPKKPNSKSKNLNPSQANRSPNPIKKLSEEANNKYLFEKIQTTKRIQNLEKKIAKMKSKYISPKPKLNTPNHNSRQTKDFQSKNNNANSEIISHTRIQSGNTIKETIIYNIKGKSKGRSLEKKITNNLNNNNNLNKANFPNKEKRKNSKNKFKQIDIKNNMTKKNKDIIKETFDDLNNIETMKIDKEKKIINSKKEISNSNSESEEENPSYKKFNSISVSINNNYNYNLSLNKDNDNVSNTITNWNEKLQKIESTKNYFDVKKSDINKKRRFNNNNDIKNNIDELKIKKLKPAPINSNNRTSKNKTDMNFKQNTFDDNKYKKEKNEKNISGNDDDKGGVFSSIMNYIFGLNKNKKLPPQNTQSNFKIDNEKKITKIIKRNTDKNNDDIKDGKKMLYCHNSLNNLNQKKINISDVKDKNYNSLISNSSFNLCGKRYINNNKEEQLNNSNSFVNRKLYPINNNDLSFNKNICNYSMNNNMNNINNNNSNNNSNNIYNKNYSNSVFNLYDFQDKKNTIFDKDDLVETTNTNSVLTKKYKRLIGSPGQVYSKRKLNITGNKPLTTTNTNKYENEGEFRQFTFDKNNNNPNNYYLNYDSNNTQEFEIQGRKIKKEMFDGKFNSSNLDENLNINNEKKIQEIIINVNSKKTNKNNNNNSNNVAQSCQNLNLDEIYNSLNDGDINLSKLKPKQEIESCIITFNKPKKTNSSCQMPKKINDDNYVISKKHSFCNTKSLEMNDFLTDNPYSNEVTLTSREHYKKSNEINNYPNVNTELSPADYNTITNSHKNLMYYNPVKPNPNYSLSNKNIFKIKNMQKMENISNTNNNYISEIKNFGAPTPNANNINVQNSLDFMNENKNLNSTPNSPGKVYQKPFGNDNNKNNENNEQQINARENLVNDCKNIKTTSVKLSLGDKIKNKIKEVNNFIYSKNVDKNKETEYLTYVKKSKIGTNEKNNEEDEKSNDKNNYKTNINENIMKITNSIRYNNLNNIQRIKINDNKRSLYEKYYNFYISKPLISNENYYITKIKLKNPPLKKIKTIIISKNKKNKTCDNLNNSFCVNERTSIKKIDDILGTKKNNRSENENNKSVDYSVLKIFSKEISEDALFNLSQDEEDDDIISVDNEEENYSKKSSINDTNTNNESVKNSVELNDNKPSDDHNNTTLLNTTNNKNNSNIYIPKKLSANKKNQNMKNQNLKSNTADNDINKFYCYTEDNNRQITYNKEKVNKIKEFYIDYEKNNISPKDDFDQNNIKNRIICINIDLNQKKKEKGLSSSKETHTNEKNKVDSENCINNTKLQKDCTKKKINYNINEEIINILNVINENNIQIVINKLFDLLFKGEIDEVISNQYSFVEIVIEKILLNSKNNNLYSKLCKMFYNKIEQKINSNIKNTENLKTIIDEELRMNFQIIFDENKKESLINLITFINGLTDNKFLATKDTFYFYNFLIGKYNEATDKEEKKLFLEYILEILPIFGKILNEEKNLKYLQDVDKFINEDLSLIILNKNNNFDINEQLWEKINNLVNLHKNGWKTDV